jgi:hypothetical protein
MTQTQVHNLKLQIIKNTLLFLNGKKELREGILSDLKVLANTFNLKTSKVAKIDPMTALIRFIDYDKGCW